MSSTCYRCIAIAVVSSAVPTLVPAASCYLVGMGTGWAAALACVHLRTTGSGAHGVGHGHPICIPCITHAALVSSAVMTGRRGVLVAGVLALGLVGGLTSGCGSGSGSVGGPTGVADREVSACEGWAAAWNSGPGLATRVMQVDTADAGRAGTLMSVFIARAGLGDKQDAGDLVAIQSRCAEVGVVFEYQPAST